MKVIELEKFSFSDMQNLKTVFVNTLTADDKYSLLNRDNLTQPIQILLPQKKKTFFQFYSAFYKSILNFEHFEKNMTVIADVFRNLPTPQNVIR